MIKIIIYGLGKRFEQIVMCNHFIRNKLNDYKVAGFVDREKSGTEFVFNNEKYTVTLLNQWRASKVDKVVITTNKYMKEIEDELKVQGFEQQQIWKLDDMISDFYDELVHIECLKNKAGVEIGGPSAVFFNIYAVCKSCDGVNFCEDTVWWKKEESGNYMWKDRRLGRVYIADATDLYEVTDNAYDFVLSSNNLEHVANPMKAFKEFYRVVKKGGIIIIVVPRKYVTFDHRRQFTPFEHLLQDYKNDVKEDDLSHLSEIIEQHDYDMDIPCGGKEAFIRRAKKNFENRCLHHHVFDIKCLRNLFDYFNMEVLETADTYKNFWIVGKK